MKTKVLLRFIPFFEAFLCPFFLGGYSAVKMVTEQGRPSKEVAAELGICIDTLKSWLKRAGFQPGATDRQNRSDKRQRELEAEIRSLRKQLAEKEEVIDVLKKSVGIFSKL